MKYNKHYYLGRKPVKGSVGEFIEKIMKPQSMLDFIFQGSRLNQEVDKLKKPNRCGSCDGDNYSENSECDGCRIQI